MSTSVWCVNNPLKGRKRPLHSKDDAHVSELRESLLNKNMISRAECSELHFGHEMHNEYNVCDEIVRDTYRGFALEPNLHLRVVDGRHHCQVLRAEAGQTEAPA